MMVCFFMAFHSNIMALEAWNKSFRNHNLAQGLINWRTRSFLWRYAFSRVKKGNQNLVSFLPTLFVFIGLKQY